MYDIERTYWFSAAHRIPGHPKCGRLHGHNYRVDVKLESSRLGDNGMLMDFVALDGVVKPIIDPMDHHYLIGSAQFVDEFDRYMMDNHKDWVVLIPNIHATTAELLARSIAFRVRVVHNVILEVEVTVWETPRSRATFRTY